MLILALTNDARITRFIVLWIVSYFPFMKFSQLPNSFNQFVFTSTINCYDLFFLFRALVEKLSVVELERWAVINWAIWNARNKYYFENTQTHPKGILSGALSFLQEYQTFMAAQLHSWATGVATWSLGWFGNSMF